MKYIVRVGEMYVSNAVCLTIYGWTNIEISECYARIFDSRGNAETVAEKVGGKIIEVSDD